MRRTKIVCTLGPSTDDEQVLKQLMQSGMDVARFNFSHSNHEEHKRRLDTLKRLREEMKLHVAALLDTKGPEIRIGLFKDGRIQLNQGDVFTLTTRDVPGDEKIVSVTYKQLPYDVYDGCKILIDDGLIEMQVINHTETDIACRVINGGIVSNNKGVNVPNVSLTMPYISEKDKDDIIFGAESGFDFIAASFARSAKDILDIRKVLTDQNCHSIKIIAKIENQEGVGNIDEILRVADGVMVARGDMGVEIPFEDVPSLQKIIIKKCVGLGKIVITATQMLDSMIKNPRPTRAEATDVANAIYDGTSAIMLSGETAAGAYPVEALKTMVKIAIRTEGDIDFSKRFKTRETECSTDITNAISHATCTTAQDLGAKAIVTVTISGKTARMISKYRPVCPIVGCTLSPQVARQLSLSWGVTPVLIEEEDQTDALFDHAVNGAENAGLVKNGDLVVITAGIPLKVSGTTNMIKVHVVGDILASGTGISSKKVRGRLCVCKDEEEAFISFKCGDILVIDKTTNNLLPILKNAAGIVCEEDGFNSHAAVVGLTLDIPVIIGAENATNTLSNGSIVELDASRGIISTVR